MKLMAFLLSACILFEGVASAAMDPQRSKALVTRGLMHKLPHDLLKQNTGWIINDWGLLKQVFHRSDRTQGILDFVDLKAMYLPKCMMENGITVSGGRIVGICFAGKGLKNEDIANLSKLPPQLRYLNLARNPLETLNTSVLPQGLRTLDLTQTNLESFIFSSLPTGLKHLVLRYNRLTAINLDGLPDALEELDLAENHFTDIYWSNLPESLTWINFTGCNLTEINLYSLPPNVRRITLSNNPGLVVHIKATMMVQVVREQNGVRELAMRCIEDDSVSLTVIVDDTARIHLSN